MPAIYTESGPAPPLFIGAILPSVCRRQVQYIYVALEKAIPKRTVWFHLQSVSLASSLWGLTRDCHKKSSLPLIYFWVLTWPSVADPRLSSQRRCSFFEVVFFCLACQRYIANMRRRETTGGKLWCKRFGPFFPSLSRRPYFVSLLRFQQLLPETLRSQI